MKRMEIKTLLLGDDDLECRRENMPLKELNLLDTAFVLSDLEPFDLIVYEGKKGRKILKSRFFKGGIIS